MKKLILLVSFIFLFSILSSAQVKCPTMPAGFLCISQEAGNKAAENVRELEATKEKVIVLENSLIEKDKSISEIRATAAKNESDLKEQNSKLLTDVAVKTGQIIIYEKYFTRDSAWLEFLIKTARGKQNGLLNVKIGGN